MNPEQTRNLMLRVAAGDPSAADDLDLLADQLRSLAARLRAGASDNPRSTGGVIDRVQMALIGPDGTVKQRTDTNPPR